MFRTAQQKYSAYDRKFLAIYEAVKYFRHFLLVRQFNALTDNKTLIFAFHQKKDKCSSCQFNHLDVISQFTTDIRHISGQEIAVIALSRGCGNCAPVTKDALAAAHEDDELQSLLVSTTARKTPHSRYLSQAGLRHLGNTPIYRVLYAARYSILCIH
jgi:hypothetical protein